MSQRFQRWVETWIDDNVIPGAHVDIESDEARAERLTERICAEAAAEGFSTFEIQEERKRVLLVIKDVLGSRVEFDIDRYHLAWQLAMEHEDGD